MVIHYLQGLGLEAALQSISTTNSPFYRELFPLTNGKQRKSHMMKRKCTNPIAAINKSIRASASAFIVFITQLSYNYGY